MNAPKSIADVLDGATLAELTIEAIRTVISTPEGAMWWLLEGRRPFESCYCGGPAGYCDGES
jgi:hypothetical protein